MPVELELELEVELEYEFVFEFNWFRNFSFKLFGLVSMKRFVLGGLGKDRWSSLMEVCCWARGDMRVSFPFEICGDNLISLFDFGFTVVLDGFRGTDEGDGDCKELFMLYKRSLMGYGDVRVVYWLEPVMFVLLVLLLLLLLLFSLSFSLLLVL